VLNWATVRDRVAAAATMNSTEVDLMIADAQAFLEQQTGRYFGLPASATQVLTGTGGFLLFLPDKLQTGTPAVTERAYPGAAETAVTGFEVRQGKAGTTLARTDGSLWRQGYEYEVVYTRGYLVDSGPPDILRLALDLIALRLNQQDLEGLQSGSIGKFSFTRFSGNDLDSVPGAQSTIHAWRRPVLV